MNNVIFEAYYKINSIMNILLTYVCLKIYYVFFPEGRIMQRLFSVSQTDKMKI